MRRTLDSSKIIHNWIPLTMSWNCLSKSAVMTCPTTESDPLWTTTWECSPSDVSRGRPINSAGWRHSLPAHFQTHTTFRIHCTFFYFQHAARFDIKLLNNVVVCLIKKYYTLTLVQNSIFLPGIDLSLSFHTTEQNLRTRKRGCAWSVQEEHLVLIVVSISCHRQI